jgi:uncharacterized membrane protein
MTSLSTGGFGRLTPGDVPFYGVPAMLKFSKECRKFSNEDRRTFRQDLRRAVAATREVTARR